MPSSLQLPPAPAELVSPRGKAARAALSGCCAEGIPVLLAGEKPHKCELCDFTCRDVSYLSKHMLTHSNDKNFMCTECGYITKWKHYLNVHMRKHTGDLRYDSQPC